ncbi:zinc finger protein CONSTANS-LIKE 2 isoform X2 [Asparagus officinalis]|uniref:zinc finger protein CONSTANS-LIKE 2 isoform X2 n=1 Tax=Asparagus officinalis TaxID=4686 RepID=UPI00098E59F8|nr:zinc finger protein CONSTANS-LIKE 2 isoform X2 [Asparagus officinalis]
MMRDCDSCRSAPASVYCEADAASLCSACDAEVHAANFISHRHHRVPVVGMEEYNEGEQSNYAALFGEEVDEYLDLVEFGSCEEKKSGLSFECVKSEVPLSSVETNSVVPDSTSNPHIRPSKGTIELFSGPPIQVPTQFSTVDREARVLRYREKKKMRKFEKTIRYASRKAYAEARPRIKGRFAKRSDVELEVDQMFSNYVVVSEEGYGIVPSF